MTATTTNNFHNHGDVDTQVGVNNGVIHKTSIYNNDVGEPPETKFENALTYLRGGQPRMAERLLEQVRQAGLVSIRFHYYYVLTILSDRTLNELPPSEFKKIVFELAGAKTSPETPGEYHRALWVVERLIAYIERQDRTADPSGGELHEVSTAFRELPAARQQEIARHLDMILDGAVQDSLDASIAVLAEQRRMDNRREHRAWLYFQPEPAPPLLAEPAKAPVDVKNWAMFVLGALAALWGLVRLFDFLTGAAPASAWIALLASLAWAFILVWFRIQAKVMDRRRGVREARLRGWNEGPPPEVPHWKIEEISWRVHSAFDAERPPKRTVRHHVNPKNPEPQKDWDADTAGLRVSMVDWFVRIYGATRTEPSGLMWLIRWHTRRIREQWQADELHAFRKELKTPWYAKALPVAGVVLLVLFGLSLIGMRPGPGALFAIGLGVCAFGASEVLATFRVRAALRADYAEQLREEEEAYRGWLELLRDRPSDDEIAYWLRFDVLHLKCRAMRRSQLSSKDIICHVELTEGAPGALRARDRMAPVRYSEYWVKVFLLTSGGVHETEYWLDFFNGNVHDPHDMSFRYDAVASATLNEVGVQFAGKRRHIVRMGDNVQVGDQFTFQQAMQLSLVNSQDIYVLVDDFRGMTDESEDQGKLREIAQQSSGVQSALHILQAVAREGREWISRQRARRERRWQDFAEQQQVLELRSGWEQRREIE